MKNPNYLYNIQVNIIIMKEDNPSLGDRKCNFIKEQVKKITNDLFKKTNEFIVLEESHKYTINILGAFEPYHYDRLKNGDSLLKYKSSGDWARGETKNIVNEYLKDIKKTIFIGFMNFEELN